SASVILSKGGAWNGSSLWVSSGFTWAAGAVAVVAAAAGAEPAGAGAGAGAAALSASFDDEQAAGRAIEGAITGLRTFSMGNESLTVGKAATLAAQGRPGQPPSVRAEQDQRVSRSSQLEPINRFRRCLTMRMGRLVVSCTSVRSLESSPLAEALPSVTPRLGSTSSGSGCLARQRWNRPSLRIASAMSAASFSGPMPSNERSGSGPLALLMSFTERK